MLKGLRLTEMQSRSDSNNTEISTKHKISNGAEDFVQCGKHKISNSAKISNNAESERFRTVRQIA